MRVLLVDVHIMFREGLKTLLSNESGFEVVGEAGTARGAVELAFKLKPDLVLMDIHLPDEEGLDVIKKIQMQQPDTNVVILTNSAQDDLLFGAIRFGAKGFMLKNLSIAKLVASIRGLERGEMALSRSMVSRICEKLVQMEDYPSPILSGLELLSKREREVLAYLVRGDSNHKIAEQLFISSNTVKKHVRSILEKLHQKNRNQIIFHAREWSLPNTEEISIHIDNTPS